MISTPAQEHLKSWLKKQAPSPAPCLKRCFTTSLCLLPPLMCWRTALGLPRSPCLSVWEPDLGTRWEGRTCGEIEYSLHFVTIHGEGALDIRYKVIWNVLCPSGYPLDEPPFYDCSQCLGADWLRRKLPGDTPWNARSLRVPSWDAGGAWGLWVLGCFPCLKGTELRFKPTIV